VYLFETHRGPVLVDAGWDDDTSWQRLTDGVQQAGYEVADVFGVLVTHMHPDHHGLSGRVREASGAWVAMHELDAALVTRVAHTGADFKDELGQVLLEAGASEAELNAPAAANGDKRRARSAPVAPDRLLDDGDRADVPGWDVQAVWTPGHSPGHLCFRVPSHGLLLAGDHVLPTITPHIGGATTGDPLEDFFASLEAIARTPDVSTVLPAHGHPFEDLPGRVKSIHEHHMERLEKLREVGAELDGWTTVVEYSHHLFRERSWGHMAESETWAHLEHLALTGRAESRFNEEGMLEYLVS
jgi:glyoxylase-like metal-dependent hydrolase (beta-lactamase superfamily II)